MDNVADFKALSPF